MTHMAKRRGRALPFALAGVAIAGAVVVAWVLFARAPVPQQGRLGGVVRINLVAKSGYLALEFLDDELLHLEFSDRKDPPPESHRLGLSPAVVRRDFAGPTRFARDGNRIETAALRVTVDLENLCFVVHDLRRDARLTELCPDYQMGNPSFLGAKRLSINPAGTHHVYGLGQYMTRTDGRDGSRVGDLLVPGSNGNTARYVEALGGTAHIAQLPMLYGLNDDGGSFGLFLDQPMKHLWNFQFFWWYGDVLGDRVRLFILGAGELPALRRQYLGLTGLPPLPPKKVLGLWASEYGYAGWHEVDAAWQSLRAGGFPIDGVALDLQWFGGDFFATDDARRRSEGERKSRTGTLTFDESPQRFPEPARTMERYARERGLAVMLLEQPYVAKNLPEHAILASASHPTIAACQREALFGWPGFLALSPEGEPALLESDPWWGRGGMLDWTHPGAGACWHDWKRQPLIDMGVRFHWTDLGEPESFREDSRYFGDPATDQHRHIDIHNLYAFRWLESIALGYLRHGATDRAYLMSRAGAPGLQRLGAGMWSGDLGAKLGSLRAHYHEQAHLSLAGIDYYSSDLGGFYRGGRGSDEELATLYSRWLANAALLDLPLRTHAWNLDKRSRVLPSTIGDVASNLANVRMRYQLAPYLYDAMARAAQDGEPVLPPLVFRYQHDANVRGLASHKLLGRDLLMAVITEVSTQARDVYLPKGRWFDFHTSAAHESRGEFLRGVPLSRGGILRAPLFARAGAIIPMAYVDGRTLDVTGRREGPAQGPNPLVLRVFASETATTYVHHEDDGVTLEYRRAGRARRTEIAQRCVPGAQACLVELATPTGTFTGAASRRAIVVELVGLGAKRARVRLDGELLAPCPLGVEVARAENACVGEAQGATAATTGLRPVARAAHFRFER